MTNTKVYRRSRLFQDECFYCATGQQHPVVTNDDDVTVKENWRRYSDSRYNAQGVLTRANSELMAQRRRRFYRE